MSDRTNIQCGSDGPLFVRGVGSLEAAEGGREWPAGKLVALCRCGASANKPFCDGKHRAAGFSDAGARPDASLVTRTTSEGPGRIRVHGNGPLGCSGAELVGFAAEEARELWLCRCGASGNKPFCDGSHERVGFRG